MTNTQRALTIALNDAALDVHSRNLNDVRGSVLDLLDATNLDSADVREAATVDDFRTAVALVVRYVA